MKKISLWGVVLLLLFLVSCSEKNVVKTPDSLTIESSKANGSVEQSSIQQIPSFTSSTKKSFPTNQPTQKKSSFEKVKVTPIKFELENYLPQQNVTLNYRGTGEYGHFGKLKKIFSSGTNSLYDFYGTYNDSSGISDTFAIRYTLDPMQGTMTEMVLSNSKTKTNEVNSKIHNFIILRTPIILGNTWSSNIKFDGVDKSVMAKIVKINSSNGEVSVKYTVKNVFGYYQNTYLEDRTFKKGYGLISFSNLLPGDIKIKEEEKKDTLAIEKALEGRKFGYTLSR